MRTTSPSTVVGAIDLLRRALQAEHLGAVLLAAADVVPSGPIAALRLQAGAPAVAGGTRILACAWGPHTRYHAFAWSAGLDRSVPSVPERLARSPDVDLLPAGWGFDDTSRMAEHFRGLPPVALVLVPEDTLRVDGREATGWACLDARVYAAGP